MYRFSVQNSGTIYKYNPCKGFTAGGCGSGTAVSHYVCRGTIDYRIQGLETVKITGFIRISPFRKLRTLASVLL